MRAKELRERCKTTRKALAYYEEQGLLAPLRGENGYREYAMEDVLRLEKILLFRKLGASIEEIRRILEKGDFRWEVEDLRRKRQLAEIKAKEESEVLEKLLAYDDLSVGMEEVRAMLERKESIVKRLTDAFPGGYGVYIGIHFGRFLQEPLETKRQKKAYEEVLAYLDEVEVPEELGKLIESSFAGFQVEQIAAMEEESHRNMEDFHGFYEQNKEMLQEYYRFVESEEYKKSDAYRLQELLVKFQSTSGYTERFLPAMRRLSPAYDSYLKRMEEVSKEAMERYPEMAAYEKKKAARIEAIQKGLAE